MKSCTSNPDEYGGLLGYKCRQPAHRLEAQTNHLPLYRQEEVRNATVFSDYYKYCRKHREIERVKTVFPTYSSPTSSSSSSSEDEPVSSRSRAIPTGISSGSFHTAQVSAASETPSCRFQESCKSSYLQ